MNDSDYRIDLDQAIFGLGSNLDMLSDALDSERDAEYLAGLENQAILNSRLTKLILVCSILRERGRQRRELQAAE